MQHSRKLSSELAELAVTFGALDERLRSGPEGWTHRLALMDVSDLGWWTGDRISVDRLALWTGLRIGATSDDVQALFRAGWAVRRLTSGAAPSTGGWETGLTAFLDRMAQGMEDVPEAVADLAEVMRNAEGLHPVTQAAIAFHAWRALSQGIGQDTEAAIVAARHAAVDRTGRCAVHAACVVRTGCFARGRQAAGKTLGVDTWDRAGGVGGFVASGSDQRMGTRGAREATADLSGRTPPLLIEALTAWPMVSAPLAEELTQSSRAAAQRKHWTVFARRGFGPRSDGAGAIPGLDRRAIALLQLQISHRVWLA